MMRKALGIPFEFVHLVGVAFFFGIGALLTLLSAPDWRSHVSSLSNAAAEKRFQDVLGLLGKNATWLAAAALVGAVAAPYARVDARKLVPWIRTVCCAAMLAIVVDVWGRGGGAAHEARGSDHSLTLWNGLALATALDLLLAAWCITGGPPKAAKKEGK